MQIEAGKILSKYLKECHDIHGVQIPDKYIPYISSAIKSIALELLKEASENAEMDGDEGSCFDGVSIDKQSITSTINKLKF